VNAVEFQSVSKSYAIYQSPGDRLKELATFHRKAFHRDFWALRDLSFTIEKGETFCVIGENGAGKSTLLQIVAGILQPTDGTVRIAGRVSALLELGSGFNPEFTGRDNVHLNGAILGFSTHEIDAKYKQIEEFAEIGAFMGRPIKTYSSGMVVRLAFAVAIHADPDILLVDEALSVGDAYFRQKCMRKVHEMRSNGVTILFVSHATGDVRAIGDRTLWIEQGRVRELGDTDTVVARYLEAAARKDAAYVKTRGQEAVKQFGGTLAPDQAQEIAWAPAEHIPNVDHRHGDGRAQVTGIAVLNEHGEPVSLLQPSSRVILRMGLRANAQIERPVAGFMLRNHLGIDFSGTDTSREGLQLPQLAPDKR
jgi:lipopolysaccharide transport system ATP-binding protein